MSVASSTRSQLEIRFLFKSFVEFCEASEAFSFTFLQQVMIIIFPSLIISKYRQIVNKFKTVVPVKKLAFLIQKSARNITNEQNMTVIIENIRNDLESDFQSLQKGKNNIDLIYANIILIGNLLLYTFSHTSELVYFLHRAT